MPVRRLRALALEPALVDMLLTGQTLIGEEADRFERDTGLTYDRFLEFDVTDDALKTAWRRHRAALLNEWQKTRVGSDEPWGARFDRDERSQR